MLRTVFADPEVAALFEQQFVNVARESGQAVLVFTDAGGNELHRVRNIMSPEDLLRGGPDGVGRKRIGRNGEGIPSGKSPARISEELYGDVGAG